jgi:hypothetical protein
VHTDAHARRFTTISKQPAADERLILVTTESSNDEPMAAAASASTASANAIAELDIPTAAATADRSCKP